MLYVWRDFKNGISIGLACIKRLLNSDPPMGKILVQECYLNGCPHLAIFEIPDAVESDNLVKKKVRCRVQDLGKGVKKYKLDQNGLERSAR